MLFSHWQVSGVTINYDVASYTVFLMQLNNKTLVVVPYKLKWPCAKRQTTVQINT